MLRFRKFLGERRRTEGEAVKLLRYIQSRTLRKGASEYPDTMKAPGQPPVLRYIAKHKGFDPTREKEFSPNTLKRKDLEYVGHRKIPLSDIHAMQDRVSISNVIDKVKQLAKDPDYRRSEVLATGPAGHQTYHRIDAHHLDMARKVLGLKMSRADVYKVRAR